eukprot:2304821-Prymnesium_polylepis.1
MRTRRHRGSALRWRRRTEDDVPRPQPFVHTGCVLEFAVSIAVRSANTQGLFHALKSCSRTIRSTACCRA